MEKATTTLVSEHGQAGCPECGGLAVYRQVEPGRIMGAYCSWAEGQGVFPDTHLDPIREAATMGMA
jgi:hypothetical protein